MEEIIRLCRPDIYAMKPYSSARTEAVHAESVHAEATIYLDANESPYPPHPGDGSSVGLNRYPDPQPEILLDRFSAIFAAPAESLFLSRGADEAIDLLVRAFCAAGTDGIMITPPTFVMYETAAEIQGAAVHRVPLLQMDTFDLDVERMVTTQASHPSIKLVFVCSPNNPTANLMKRADILRLATKLHGKALLIVDELYADYSGSPSIGREIPAHPNLIALRSLSKEYSLAGERIGITVAHPEVIRILRRIMPPYPLATSAIRVVSKAITPEGIEYSRANIQRVLDERRRVEAELASSPAVLRVFPSDANFVLVQTVDPQLLVATMAANSIRIRDRSQSIEHAVRISIGTPHENDTMLRVFAEYATQVTAGSTIETPSS